MNSLVLANLEFLLALLIWHKALPTVLHRGILKAFEIWSLGMVLALLGGGNLMHWMNDTRSVHWMIYVAQYILLVHVILRIRHIFALGLRPWWNAR